MPCTRGILCSFVFWQFERQMDLPDFILFSPRLLEARRQPVRLWSRYARRMNQ
jgi:hypothetical protein